MAKAIDALELDKASVVAEKDYIYIVEKIKVQAEKKATLEEFKGKAKYDFLSKTINNTIYN